MPIITRKTLRGRIVTQRVTARYKDLFGKEAINEYSFDLHFEFIYAHKKGPGRKPLKKLSELLEKGRMQHLVNKNLFNELKQTLFAAIRGQKEIDEPREFILKHLSTEN